MKGKNRTRWTLTEVLIIDEISMVHPRLFETLEFMARKIRKNALPFGGLQIILSGDWAQLPPVPERDSPDKYRRIKFAFQTETWPKAIPDANIIFLKQNFRQAKDAEFQELLYDMRHGVLTRKSRDLLESRVDAKLDLPHGVTPTTLMSNKDAVAQYNAMATEMLPGKLYTFEWILRSERLRDYEQASLFDKLIKALPVDKTIGLKVGSNVILRQNLSMEKGFINGMKGVVTHFDKVDGCPTVMFVTGTV